MSLKNTGVTVAVQHGGRRPVKAHSAANHDATTVFVGRRGRQGDVRPGTSDDNGNCTVRWRPVVRNSVAA